MKILNLKLYNIASLKGHHEVNFEEVASTSNLFAITGKTGAGKSTLLNSISLALYGEVYKKGTSGKDYITTGESSGEIELCFSVSEHIYKSIWSLRLTKKNGEILKKPLLSRLLFRVTDQMDIAIDTTIEEITKLDFNQFCKTTILNQGEFAKFLTSNFTERKEILQKFYNGENLDLLNGHLRNKLNLMQNKISSYQNTISGLTQSYNTIDIGENQLTELKNDISKRVSFINTLQKIHLDFKDLQVTFSINKNSLERANSTYKLIETLTNDFNENTFTLNKLKKSLILEKSHFATKAPLLKEAIKTKVKLVEKKLAQEKMLNTHKQLLSLKNNLELSLIEKSSQHKSFTEDGKKVTEIIPSIITYHLDEVRRDFAKLELVINEKDNFHSQLQILKQTKNNKAGQIKRLISSLNKLELTQNANNIDDLNHSINNEQATHNLYLTSKDKIKSQLECIEQDSLQSTSLLQLNETYLKDLNKEHPILLELKNKLKRIKLFQENQTLELSISLCQKESSSKNECVVCYSKDLVEMNKHFEQSPHHSHQVDDLDIDQLNKEIETKVLLIQQIEIQIESTNQKIKDLNKQRELNTQMIQDSVDVFPLDNTALRSFLNSSPAKLLEIIQTKILVQQSTLQNSIELKNNYLISLDNIKLINSQTQEFQSELKRLESQDLLIQTKLDSNINTILQTFEKYGIKKYQLGFSLRDDIKQLLSDVSNFLDLKHKINLVLIEIKNTQQSMLDNSHKNKVLEEELEQVNLLITEYSVSIKAHTTSGMPEQELEELESRIQLSTQEIDQLKSTNQQQAISLAELKSKRVNYIEQVNSSKLKLFELINSISEYVGSCNHFLSLKDEHPHLFNILEKLPHIEIDNVELEIINLTLLEYQDILKIFVNSTKVLEVEYAGHRSLLDQKIKTQLKVKEIENDLTRSHAEYDDFAQLNQLIGKDEFRNYVLSIIEELLIQQTNKELKLLCQGRYAIEHTQGRVKMSSEFNVVDYFNDGQQRKVTTLSGGETFLVSLAMAMALAELTRGTAQIDSLFIDEGFGSLDTESIQDVLDLLTEVQSSGKQIGIISHVKELTQRIPLNIDVQKSDNGNSKINIFIN